MTFKSSSNQQQATPEDITLLRTLTAMTSHTGTSHVTRGCALTSLQQGRPSAASLISILNSVLDLVAEDEEDVLNELASKTPKGRRGN